jgi:hypothetical protein
MTFSTVATVEHHSRLIFGPVEGAPPQQQLPWAAPVGQPENGIIHIQERHLRAYRQYRRLPGPFTNRDAYRKPVDWQLNRMLDYLSYDGVWLTLAISAEGRLS